MPFLSTTPTGCSARCLDVLTAPNMPEPLARLEHPGWDDVVEQAEVAVGAGQHGAPVPSVTAAGQEPLADGVRAGVALLRTGRA